MKKTELVGALIALAGSFTLTFSPLSAAAEEAAPVFSYGLQVLSAATDMAVSAPIGNEIAFSEDAFRRALNLSALDSVTVHTVPDASAGELLLASERVAAGQVIPASALSMLTFCPATEDVAVASFLFSANKNASQMVCNMYLMSEENYTPTVSMAPALSLNLTAHKGLETHGTLRGFDPDGDGLIFEIVSYPENGAVRLTDRALGAYVYTPLRGYLGTDSFSYVVRDKYGNYSAAATVHVRVVNSGTSVTYADMEDSSALGAALTLTASGVMSGTQVGKEYYFYPEKEVTRAEFLVMAMHAVGITEVPPCDATVFADDADIPDAMRDYVAAAYEMKYISGSLENGKLCFLPDETITRAQAAVILSNIVGLCEVPVTPTFADTSEIPVWAREAIFSLNAAGIMDGNAGYISPTSPITRAQTATLLAAAMQYVG